MLPKPSRPPPCKASVLPVRIARVKAAMRHPPTISFKTLKKEAGSVDEDAAPTDYRRPASRGECMPLERPCPFVACRHHLFLEVKPCGSISFPFGKDLSALETMPQTCALDAAEQGAWPIDDVAEALRLSRNGVRQLLDKGMANVGVSEKVRTMASELDH